MNTLLLAHEQPQDANHWEKALVQLGRQEFVSRLGQSEIEFDRNSWNIKGLRNRTTQKTAPLYFSRYKKRDEPLPKVYAEVVKSIIILDGKSVSHLAQLTVATRILWEAILVRRGASNMFTWASLSEQDLNQAEHLMHVYFSLENAYGFAHALVTLCKSLTARNICRELFYKVQTPKPNEYAHRTFAGREARLSKLPSSNAIAGLADIYHEHAKSPPDRLLAAAIALLIVTGFRIGELLTLPLDCEVEETHRDRSAYGLRYYVEKARGKERMFTVRWLTQQGAILARKAIAEIRDITAETRQQANRLEQNPGRVPLPGYESHEQIDVPGIQKTTGLSQVSIASISHIHLPRRISRRAYYNVSDVETYLFSKQGSDPLWTVDLRNGKYQWLSETLLIIPQYFFSLHRNPNTTSVRSVMPEDVSQFLRSRRGGKLSAFERFNICEDDGTFCAITSHQIRHWLNDVADKGHLPNDLQTRWFGRSDPKQTIGYQHATLEERINWVKEGVLTRRLAGELVDFCTVLADEEISEFLDGQIQAVHISAFGICTHNFAIAPCPYYLNCVRGCPEYLRTKGDQRERTNLIQLVDRTEIAYNNAKAAAAALNAEVAPAWHLMYEETIAGAKAALAVDKAPGSDSFVKPFAGQPSKFQPLPD